MTPTERLSCLPRRDKRGVLLSELRFGMRWFRRKPKARVAVHTGEFPTIEQLEAMFKGRGGSNDDLRIVLLRPDEQEAGDGDGS